MKQFLFMIMGCVLAASMPVMAATVLDFEAYANSSSHFDLHSSVSEEGYTISASGGIAVTGTGDGYNYNWADYYKGSATIWIYYINRPMSLTKDDGGAFNVDSIDLARFSDRYPGSIAVTITGYDSVGTQVASQSITLPSFGDESLHTYTLNNSFKGIYEMSMTEIPDNYFQIDNIVLSAVPEPATLSLLALGAMSVIRRRRKI